MPEGGRKLFFKFDQNKSNSTRNMSTSVFVWIIPGSISKTSNRPRDGAQPFANPPPRNTLSRTQNSLIQDVTCGEVVRCGAVRRKARVINHNPGFDTLNLHDNHFANWTNSLRSASCQFKNITRHSAAPIPLLQAIKIRIQTHSPKPKKSTCTTTSSKSQHPAK